MTSVSQIAIVDANDTYRSTLNEQSVTHHTYRNTIIVQIKICGLTRPTDAALAESLGANFLGVILAGGPRHLSVTDARCGIGPASSHCTTSGRLRRPICGGNCKRLPNSCSLTWCSCTATQAPTTFVFQERLACAIWPVVRVDSTTEKRHPSNSARRSWPSYQVWLVLDAKVPGQLGGTGVSLNWEALTQDVSTLRHRLPSLQTGAGGWSQAIQRGQSGDAAGTRCCRRIFRGGGEPRCQRSGCHGSVHGGGALHVRGTRQRR